MKTEINIEDYEKLIWKIAGRFYGVEKEDLFQAGMLGLLKASKNYQDDSEAKFSTYAMNYIFGEMYQLASNKNLKYSKDMLKLYKLIETTRYKLAQTYEKVPNNYELAEYLKMDVSDIETALGIGEVIMSLDSATNEERDYYEMISRGEENWDDKILLDESLALLNEEEQQIIRSRYYEDLTQSEIAKKLKMTQVMVSRYEKRGREKLREYMSLSA